MQVVMPRAGLEEILRLSLCFVATGGETEEEMIRVDILENQVMDVRLHMARICYSPDFVSRFTLDWTGFETLDTVLYAGES